MTFRQMSVDDVALGLLRLRKFTAGVAGGCRGPARGRRERQAFALRRDGQARVGRPVLALYGLQRGTPYANWAGMEAAFLLAQPDTGQHAVALAAEAIETQALPGARLRRPMIDPPAVLVWSPFQRKPIRSG